MVPTAHVQPAWPRAVGRVCGGLLVLLTLAACGGQGRGDSRQRSEENIKVLLRGLQSQRYGLSRPWPSRVDGKRLLLWLIPEHVIHTSDSDLAVYFSPGDATRSVAEAGGTARFGSLSFEDLRKEETDVDPLTSYQGPSTRALRESGPGSAADIPLMADLTFRDGAIVGFASGQVRWMSRADLGLGPTDPIKPGEGSASPTLRWLAER